MKNLTLSIVIILTIFSCSRKYTASFQNYSRSHWESDQVTYPAIDNENEMVLATEETQSISLNDEVPDEILTASSTNRPIDIKISQPALKSTKLESLSKEERKILKKKIKSEIKSSKQEPTKEKSGKESRNIFAYLGFGLSVVGLILGFLFPPLFVLLIPGTIFSIIGLWSKKKGWAIAGILLPVVIAGLILILFATAEWS